MTTAKLETIQGNENKSSFRLTDVETNIILHEEHYTTGHVTQMTGASAKMASFIANNRDEIEVRDE